MTDIRDKIAAAIDRRYNDEAIGHTYEVCLHAADAVIRELKLTREDWQRTSVWEDRKPPAHRYVTEWTETND